MQRKNSKLNQNPLLCFAFSLFFFLSFFLALLFLSTPISFCSRTHEETRNSSSRPQKEYNQSIRNIGKEITFGFSKGRTEIELKGRILLGGGLASAMCSGELV